MKNIKLNFWKKPEKKEKKEVRYEVLSAEERDALLQRGAKDFSRDFTGAIEALARE